MKHCAQTFLSVVARCAVFAAVAIGAAVAQTDTAGLFGLVQDPSGATVAAAKVRLLNSGTNAVREQVTDSRGVYHFEALAPGRYELVVEAAGFKQFRDAHVQLQVAQTSRLNISMEIGSANEFVEVQGSVSALATESVAQGTIVGQPKIVQLPLNGRQFIQLALLVPGASVGGRAVQQNVIRQGQVGGLSIAGGRTNNTSFLLDGAVNVDPDYNSLNYSPQIDSIAEFQVQTAMVSAEYGRATINIATRSGTNDIHGSAFEFLRNRVLDARPFNLNSELPKYQRNQFGGTLGAPVIKNKLFQFLSYEGLAIRQAGSGLTTVVLPSALKRQGDFSETPGGIFDPATLANGVRQQFPNNRIPQSRIHPFANAAVNDLPLPDNPVNSTYANSTGILTQDNHNGSGRLDYNLNSKWTLFGRYSISEEDALIPAVIPKRDVINDVRSQNGIIGATAVLRPNLVNQLRVGLSRLRILNGLPERNFDINGASTVLPLLMPAGYPTIGGSGGFQATTGGGIVLVRNNVFQIYDNVSWTVGRHSIKFGGEVFWLQYNRIENANEAGTFQYTNGFTTRTARNDGTGDSLASMMLALPAVSSRTLGPSRIDGRQRSFTGFIQDDIRLRSNLTLNLGLRYELAPPIHDKHQQMASVDYRNVPNPGQIFAEGKTGFYKPLMFVCGQSGYPKACAYTDKNNFAPRVGIVWSPTPKTVIRTGAGMFYASTDANPLFRLAAGLPANIAQTLNSDNFIPAFSGYNVFGPAIVGPVQIQAAGVDLFQRTSYTMQWNFSVQRELSHNTVFEVGYLATAGIKLEQNVQPNNALPGTGAVNPRRPYLGLEYAPGTTFPDYLVVQGNSVPVGLINYLPRSAQSNYHSLTARLEKRYSFGMSFLSSYTFSKAITNAPQFRNAGGVNGNENSPAQNAYDLRAERGLASFHNSHRSVNTFLYDLPIRKEAGFLHTVFGDTQISGIFTMQSGFPFTINLRGDTAGVGAGTGGIFVRPNAVAGVSHELSGSERSTSRYFNTDAFAAPATAAFGNIGRNTVIGPPLTNLDFVLAKNFEMIERVRVQLRLEFFNAFNHSNYNIVGRIQNDPTFGQVLNQLDPRQLQLGLKVTF